MLRFFSKGLLFIITLLGSVVGGANVWAQAGVSSATRQAASQQQSRSEVDELKQKLATAEGAEAKRKLVDEYRVKMEQRMAERKAEPPQVPKKTSHELMAEQKSREVNNPALQKRVADLEQRVASIETLKRKLTEIEAADVEEKKELVEEFRSAQRKLAQEREQEMETRRESHSPPQALPPAMQAIRVKAEERKQELEDLKATLEQAQPQERVEFIDAFRERQKTAAMERRQELEVSRSQDLIQP